MALPAATLARENLPTVASGTKLIMLGTGGGPQIGGSRAMTSHAMLSGGAAYVVDCGLGVTSQLARAGVDMGALRGIFITHHHPDHNVEYGPLLLMSWVDGRRLPVAAYGPPPLLQMTTDYTHMQEYTTKTWSLDIGITPFPQTDVHELTATGAVMHDDRVSVRCAIVEHPPVVPAFGYRFDFHDRSIAFSGDTVAVPAMVELARNADVLVHEVMDYRAIEAQIRVPNVPPAFAESLLAHMRRDHTPVREAGRIATEAGVKTLVLSHFVPASGVSDETWRRAAAETFAGEIIVARDLLVV